jgi:Zn-dependent protease with chaperone function
VSSTRRDGKRVARARRLVDGAIAGSFVVALAVGVATSVPPFGLAALVLGSVAVEHAASTAVTAGVLRNVTRESGDVPAWLRSTVADLSRDLGVDPPEILVNPEAETGVSVLRDGDRIVLLVSGPLLDRVDEASIRGVVAHELGHVALGHLRRVPLRDAVVHVVGVVALWVLVLQNLGSGQTLVVATVYFAASVTRHSGLSAVVTLVGSAGTVLVPLALTAYASRLEERQADDIAVTLTSTTAFCTGLYRTTTAGSATLGGVGAGTPAGERRGLLNRITSLYPSVEDRLARQGVAVADVADAVPDRDGSTRDEDAAMAE